MIGITAACLIRCIPVANAAGLDLCNDVLQQDIFNRTSGGSQASESERQAYLDSFFSSDVDKAYEEYKSARAEQHQSSTSVKAEGHYGIIGGEFDLSTEHGGAMSKEDFSKQFSERKAVRQSQSSGSSARDSSLISTYQSAIRDPNTIEAWRQCMLNRTSDPSIVAYGYRDGGGNPYLTVMWLPGRALASIAPEVDVNFVSPDPDITVEAANQPIKLAAGSGTAFVIRFKNADSPARYQGFAVLVNAVAHDGTRHLMDLQETANFPRTTGESPCDLLIQPNRDYSFLIIPVLLSAADISKIEEFMILRVQGTVPGSNSASHEYDGQVTYTPEMAQKIIARSHNNLKTIQRVTRPIQAWVKTDGSAFQFRMERNASEPGVLGDAGEARCTLNGAEGTLPSDQVAMRFRITARH